MVTESSEFLKFHAGGNARSTPRDSPRECSALLARAAPLKPEIRLAQAVSQFEADLSPEQKAAFNSDKHQSCISPPDISDVMGR